MQEEEEVEKLPQANSASFTGRPPGSSTDDESDEEILERAVPNEVSGQPSRLATKQDDIPDFDTVMASLDLDNASQLEGPAITKSHFDVVDRQSSEEASPTTTDEDLSFTTYE